MLRVLILILLFGMLPGVLYTLFLYLIYRRRKREVPFIEWWVKAPWITLVLLGFIAVVLFFQVL